MLCRVTQISDPWPRNYFSRDQIWKQLFGKLPGASFNKSTGQKIGHRLIYQTIYLFQMTVFSMLDFIISLKGYYVLDNSSGHLHLPVACPPCLCFSFFHHPFFPSFFSLFFILSFLSFLFYINLFPLCCSGIIFLYIVKVCLCQVPLIVLIMS